ncbi:MAG: Asp-tRNA(Asn)/Glu-tRNA(Gln) amidotransferase subunit GatC [Methyloprofundus sp.]|nr:Asp-tRNA(Asn)/Glu-tRNA(Gln) amidotransferase subunit GatC [Methyloprofundus sp.]
MSLTTDDVNKIAYLARLGINAKDSASYTENLSGMLNLVDQMSSVDTDNVVPMAHPLDTIQRLRPDKITEDIQRDHFQSIAPQVEEGLYLVPKVLD